ncbi:hypothetical protein [Sphingomonas sp.]|uniref:hypothetical protein n=1 Tax=Sphingomonas sp. TaxID=28214 RepID=UPI003CC5F968
MLFVFLLLTGQVTVPPRAAATAVRPDPMVCRYQTATGSIFPGRICKPRSQWAATDRDTERARQNSRDASGTEYSAGGANEGANVGDTRPR